MDEDRSASELNAKLQEKGIDSIPDREAVVRKPNRRRLTCESKRHGYTGGITHRQVRKRLIKRLSFYLYI
jgi:hypothetical protein